MKDGSFNFYRAFNQKAAVLQYGHDVTEQILHVTGTSYITNSRGTLVLLES